MSWHFPLLLACCLVVAGASAHVPAIAAGQVTVVPDAAKSYAWYGTLGDPGEADRYLLTVAAGDEIHLTLATPDPETAPVLALTGPGIGETGSILVMPYREAGASYEPFTPMALYDRAGLSLPAPAVGEYAVLVSGDQGRYILATGYKEEFTIAEWVLVPVSVLAVRTWQGQPLLLVLLPIIASVAAGAFWFRKREAGSQFWPGAWLLAIAGFSYAGSGILIIAQLLSAGAVTGPDSTMILTLLFAAIPLVLGAVMVRSACRLTTPPGLAGRGVMMLSGILGFVSWAGMILGPVLAVAAACMPECPVCRNGEEKGD